MKNQSYYEFLSVLLLLVLSTHNYGIYCSSLVMLDQRNKAEKLEGSTVSENPNMTMGKSIRQLHQDQVDTQELVNTLADEVKDIKTYLQELLPNDCYAAKVRGEWTHKVLVSPPGLPPRHVLCDQHTAGGGWTVVLNRQPGGRNRENFNCTWETYKSQFGSIDGEFWIGLDVLHALTAETPYEVLIQFTPDNSGQSKQAIWKTFRVGPEAKNYMLTIEDYQGGSNQLHDAMAQHNGRPFATFDKDNTQYQYAHCAQKYGAGWWYSKCHQALLTGDHTTAHEGTTHGIRYYNKAGERDNRWLELSHAKMMIKPRISQ